VAALGEGRARGSASDLGAGPRGLDGDGRPVVVPGPAAVRAVVREPVLDPMPAPVVVERLPERATPGPGDDPSAASPAGVGPGSLPFLAVLEPDGRRVTWSILEADPERLRAVRSDPAGGVGEAPGWPARIAALLGAVRREADGREIREVVVNGWRFSVEVEGARRAILRALARRADRGPGRDPGSGRRRRRRGGRCGRRRE